MEKVNRPLVESRPKTDDELLANLVYALGSSRLERPVSMARLGEIAAEACPILFARLEQARLNASRYEFMRRRSTRPFTEITQSQFDANIDVAMQRWV